MILSSPKIAAGTTYTVKTGVSVSGGVRFHNLYTTLPTITGGTSTITDFTTSSNNMVYTDSSAGNSFGNFGGGPGGMGGPGRFGGRQAFGDGEMPDFNGEMPQPPKDFVPPEGFKGGKGKRK